MIAPEESETGIVVEEDETVKLAVVEDGVLMFNCTCTNCGMRLVSMNPPEAMGFQKDMDAKKKK